MIFLVADRAKSAKAVFLDRDGVINRDSADYVKSLAEFSLVPGSLEAIAKLTRAGYEVFVITNQSGWPGESSNRRTWKRSTDI